LKKHSLPPTVCAVKIKAKEVKEKRLQKIHNSRRCTNKYRIIYLVAFAFVRALLPHRN
jgi:hypothetical protein